MKSYFWIITWLCVTQKPSFLDKNCICFNILCWNLIFGFIFALENQRYKIIQFLPRICLIKQQVVIAIINCWNGINFTTKRIYMSMFICIFSSIQKYDKYYSSTGGFEAKAFFHSVGDFCRIFSLSLIIGAVMGCATALMTKFTRIRDFPLLESALFVLMSYSTFLIAEVSELTGGQKKQQTNQRVIYTNLFKYIYKCSFFPFLQR